MSELVWLLYKCAALWRAGPPATERPLGTIREEEGISSRFELGFLSCRDIT